MQIKQMSIPTAKDKIAHRNVSAVATKTNGYPVNLPEPVAWKAVSIGS